MKAGIAVTLLFVPLTLSGAWFFVRGDTVLTQCAVTHRERLSVCGEVASPPISRLFPARFQS
jgi:hypothetical protein